MSAVEKMEKRRLPNELLAEIANAMPAGIIDLAGFMERMEPLSAFIWPRIRKFKVKRNDLVHNLDLQRGQRILKLKKLHQTQLSLLEMLDLDDAQQVDWAEVGRKCAAWDQQRADVMKEKEEWSKEQKGIKAAWNRSAQFAKELAAGEDEDKADSGDNNTVCGEEEATKETEEKA